MKELYSSNFTKKQYIEALCLNNKDYIERKIRFNNKSFKGKKYNNYGIYFEVKRVKSAEVIISEFEIPFSVFSFAYKELKKRYGKEKFLFVEKEEKGWETFVFVEKNRNEKNIVFVKRKRERDKIVLFWLRKREIENNISFCWERENR